MQHPTHPGPIGLAPFLKDDPNAASENKKNHKTRQEFEITEKKWCGNIVGFKNEIELLNKFEELSRQKDLGLKLFSGVKINEAQLKALEGARPNIALVAGDEIQEVQKSSQDLNSSTKENADELEHDKEPIPDIEIDLVVISTRVIYIIEVKSSKDDDKIFVSDFSLQTNTLGQCFSGPRHPVRL